ncbi:MAG: Mrp family chromosome partitioning ATPase [Ilumatobacter sp.]|jgi:Mrp family chromosome partitioning ATPase
MGENVALRAFQRRWWVIALFVLLGTVLGALPEPEQVEAQERTFTATHTLLLNTTNQDASSSIDPGQVTLFATTGEVPTRAAAALNFGGNPASLASQVEPAFDFSNNALTISATGAESEGVENIADTFADELVSYLAERQDAVYQDRLASSLDRLSGLENDLLVVTGDLAISPESPTLVAQQSAISRRYSVAFEESEALQSNPPVLGFTTIQRAQAVEITDTGLGAPQSRMSRGVLGGIAGVLVGAAVIALLTMLDRRIRTREQAEEAMGMRARVLIPKVRGNDRDQVVVRSNRRDPLSDSYRTLRNVLSFALNEEALERPPVTLVVSPSPGDGKTSLAINLAAASAEAGQRTVLVNADFRRPRMSSAFGPTAPEPLRYLIEDVKQLSAKELLTKSGVERLRLFDLSGVGGDAGELVRTTVEKLDQIVELSDAVFIDTSPVAATAEVLDIVPHVDAIVVIARVGHTTVAQAQRSIAILRDLTTVPIVLVLGGLKDQGASYEEYGDRLKKGGETRRRPIRAKRSITTKWPLRKNHELAVTSHLTDSHADDNDARTEPKNDLTPDDGAAIEMALSRNPDSGLGLTSEKAE